MINDISALRFDPGMARLAASAVPLVMMHMRESRNHAARESRI